MRDWARQGIKLRSHGVIQSFIIRALLMASPIVLLHIKDKPYFRQS
jgi:hypothetical protein